MNKPEIASQLACPDAPIGDVSMDAVINGAVPSFFIALFIGGGKYVKF